MTSLRQRMLEDLRIRNYAPTTVACYIRSVAEFAQHFNKPPDQLGPEEIRSWQLFLLREKRVKLSTYIQAVCALRFFYQNTLHRRIEIDRIPLPRYEKKLPVILSKAEECWPSWTVGSTWFARICATVLAAKLCTWATQRQANKGT